MRLLDPLDLPRLDDPSGLRSTDAWHRHALHYLMVLHEPTPVESDRASRWLAAWAARGRQRPYLPEAAVRPVELADAYALGQLAPWTTRQRLEFLHVTMTGIEARPDVRERLQAARLAGQFRAVRRQIYGASLSGRDWKHAVRLAQRRAGLDFNGESGAAA